MKHLAAQNSLSDSNANTKGQLVFAVILILALCASALAGAWVYARFYSSQGLLNPDQAAAGQASRDAAYLRESISLLADKVGVLQAKVIAINGLSHRVAKAAGVQHTEPELHANLPFSEPDVASLYGTGQQNDDHGAPAVLPMSLSDQVMDFIEPADDAHDGTAEGLGRRLDALYRQLAAQEDGLALLDLMLTRRTGIDASLPSYSPVDYPYLSSSFGWRRNPVTGRHAMHEGLDFAAPAGTPIYAASGGVVTQARFRSGYGNLVEIMHGNGLSTRYAHASAIKVNEGDLVERGQVIALVGSTGRSTGAHLHFEVRMAGHPLDPVLFLPQPSSEPLIADAGEYVSATDTQVR